MVSDTGALLKRIADYLAWLHVQWTSYCALFGHSPERIDLLNRRTGEAARLFQDSLLDAVVLDVAKLLDPATTLGKENLSLAAAIEGLAVPEPARVALRERRKELRAEVDTILQYRNQRIAHNDKKVALDPAASAGVSRAQIREAIGKVAKFFDEIRGVHEGGQPATHYGNLEEDAQRDVGRLIEVIERGNRELDREARARRDAWIRAYGDNDLPKDFDPGEAWAGPA